MHWSDLLLSEWTIHQRNIYDELSVLQNANMYIHSVFTCFRVTISSHFNYKMICFAQPKSFACSCNYMRYKLLENLLLVCSLSLSLSEKKKKLYLKKEKTKVNMKMCSMLLWKNLAPWVSTHPYRMILMLRIEQEH